MDEDSYRSTVASINPQACVFEQCLLARHCFCSRSHIFNLAEREGVQCQAGLRNKNCVRLKDFLRKSVNFTFHLINPDEELPFAKQIKMQAGGLIGLQQLINDKKVEKVDDVHQLVIEIEDQYPNYSQIPMADILKEIASFKVRHRKK